MNAIVEPWEASALRRKQLGAAPQSTSWTFVHTKMSLSAVIPARLVRLLVASDRWPAIMLPSADAKR